MLRQEFESRKIEKSIEAPAISNADESHLFSGIEERRQAIMRLHSALGNVYGGFGSVAHDIQYVQHWAFIAQAAQLDVNSHRLH